jgi:hypothetical protein
MIAPLLAGGVAPAAVEFRPVAPPPLPLPPHGRLSAQNDEETTGSQTSWPTEDSILAPVPRESPANDTGAAAVPLDEPFNSRLARGTGPYQRPPSETYRTDSYRSRDASGAITTAFMPGATAMGTGESFATEPAPRTAVVSVSGTRVVPWRTHILVVLVLSVCAGTASWLATLLALRGSDGGGSKQVAVAVAPSPAQSRPAGTSPVRLPATKIAVSPPGTAPAPAPAPTPTLPPVAPAPTAPLASGVAPCPTGMALVGTRAPYCIDRFESPGAGRTPRVNLTREDAQRSCAQQGKRLCTAREWERACRGKSGASYPYGSSYTAEKCRVRLGAPPGPAGATDTCLSASTAYDMSGNAAEWVQTGPPRGGSSAGTHDGRCSRPSPSPDAGRATDIGFRCCADPR